MTVEADKDRHVWLEQTDAPGVQAWIANQNDRTLTALGGARFELFRDQLCKAAENEHSPSFFPAKVIRQGSTIYELYQDDLNPRGVLRAIEVRELDKPAPHWRVLLDLDELAAGSGQNLSFPAFQFDGLRFSPSGDRLLLAVSEGGARDVIQLRELDLSTGELVDGGFETPFRKQFATWIDEDTLLIALPLHPGEETPAGYADRVRVWRRGQRLEEAQVIFKGRSDALLCGVARATATGGAHLFVLESRSFSDVRLHHLRRDGKLAQLPIPADLGWFIAMSGCLNAVGQRLLIRANEAFRTGGREFSEGSLVSIDLQRAGEDVEAACSLVYAPGVNEAIPLHLSQTATSSAAYFTVLRDVVSVLFRATPTSDGGWDVRPVEAPGSGRISLPIAGNSRSDATVAIYESLTDPPRLLELSQDGLRPLFEGPAPVTQLVTTAHFAIADDGERIPYFVTGSPSQKASPRFALLHAYGAFGTSQGLVHDIWGFGLAVRAWLQSGHLLITAYPRGGGEYGPRWHRAAVGVKKPRTAEDLAAVCQSVIADGTTTPERFAVIGGSGAGTTAATIALLRPDLFQAAICLVPALDLLSLPRMTSGVKATEEFGDATSPGTAEKMRTYSPYELVRSDRAYPSFLLVGSTLDDRVHPAHARKMAEKLQSHAHQAFFAETATGGHQMYTDAASRSFQAALQLRFLEHAFGCELIQ